MAFGLGFQSLNVHSYLHWAALEETQGFQPLLHIHLSDSRGRTLDIQWESTHSLLLGQS